MGAAGRRCSEVVGHFDAEAVAENARVTALLDVVRGADHRDRAVRADVVGRRVHRRRARPHRRHRRAAGLQPNGDSTVVVAPAWRREGIGRACG